MASIRQILRIKKRKISFKKKKKQQKRCSECGKFK